MSAWLLFSWMVALTAGIAWVRAALRARVRAELIARACHEVRGPLTAASLALHGLAQSPGGDARTAAVGVEREIVRAATVLDDVVAAGRGRRLRDRPESVDLCELLALQAATWQPVARVLGTDVHVRALEPGTTVRADRVRLVQVTSNLIANALEHGGGAVTLDAARDRDRVRIEVSDEGPSAPRAIRPAGVGVPGGSRGRGLSIVADIAERHGGRLLASRCARGTLMAVDLPRAQEPA